MSPLVETGHLLEEEIFGGKQERKFWKVEFEGLPVEWTRKASRHAEVASWGLKTQEKTACQLPQAEGPMVPRPGVGLACCVGRPEGWQEYREQGWGQHKGSDREWRGSSWFHLVPVVSVTQYHKLSSLKNQKRLISRFWRPEVQIKVLAGWVPSGGSEGETVPGHSPGFWWWLRSLAFLGLYLHHSSLCLCLHMAFSSLCVCVQISLFLQGQRSLDLGPILFQYDLILPDYICKHPISK